MTTNTQQEIVRRRVLRGLLPLAVRSSVVRFECVLQVLVHLHNRRYVAAAVAVVRSRPHVHQLVVEHPLVPLHHHLV